MANDVKGVVMNAANVAESPGREVARRRASDGIGGGNEVSPYL
jgi:hypothetical protein